MLKALKTLLNVFLFRCQPLFGGLYLSGGGGGVAMEGELFSEGNLRCVMLITRLELASQNILIL